MASGEDSGEDPDRDWDSLDLESLQASIDATPPDDPSLPSQHEALAEQYHTRFCQHSNDPNDLHLAFQHAQAALGTTPSSSTDLPSRQTLLATLHTTQYRHTGSPTDIQTATRLCQAAVRSTAPGSPDMSYRLQCLSTIYGDIVERFERREDIEAALQCSLGALDATQHGDPNVQSMQHDLAASYGDRYDRYGHLSDLESAIYYAQLSVNGAQPGSPDISTNLRSLGVAYAYRFTQLGDTSDIEMSLRYKTASVESLPAGSFELPRHLSSLSATYSHLYSRLGRLSDLDASLSYAQRAVDVSQADDPSLATRQQNLAVAYTHRARRLGELADLDLAIKWDTACVANTPADHPELGARQNGLAASHTDRYQRLGDRRDLELSLEYTQAALANTPKDDPTRADVLHRLGVSHLDMYKHTDDLTHLSSALEHMQELVDGTPEGHPALPDRLRPLGVAHSSFYRRTGDLSHLEAAIRCNQRSVDLTPPDDDEGLAGRAQNLALTYAERHKRLGDLKDMEAALKWHKVAVERTPAGHAEYAARVQGLGIEYEHRFKVLNDVEDLQEGLNYKRIAVENTPADHPDMTSRQWNLAISYRDRWTRLRDLSDLDAAQELDQAALDALPPGHPSLARLHTALGRDHIFRYEHSHKAEDLALSMNHQQLALDETPEGHPDRALRMGHLAGCYEHQYETSGNDSDLEKALDLYRMAVKSASASSDDLWVLAINWAVLAQEHRPSEAVDAFMAAFSILPDLVWLGNSLESRHAALAQNDIPKRTSRAISVALECSMPQKAVEFFEAGMSITHKQAFQLRTGDMQLWEAFPDEAKEFRALSTQLQAASGAGEIDIKQTVDAHELTLKRKRLIEQIRTRPGFERFLQPPTWETLSKAAKEGPVIILSAIEDQADAIVLLRDGAEPIQVHLPRVTVDKLEKMLESLRRALALCRIMSREADAVEETVQRYGRMAGQGSAEHMFEVIVNWLCSEIVAPIFACLRLNGITEGRIWWCPSGAFTYLPVHAAAPVEGKFVQSYTYTLEALIHARERNQNDEATDGRDESFTAVGVSNALRTPPLPKLPSVKLEVEQVARLVQASGKLHATALLDSAATLANVVEQLKTSSWLHFACHGQQDARSALNSGLELYDARLRLEQIVEASAFGAAKFVYLSACETAMGDAQLSNEAMHLAGGFVGAGFRGGIGTLWSMADAYGPAVALSVYGKMFGGGSGGPKLELAAEGLLEAIQNMRRAGAAHHYWMPFIHVGI